MTIIQLYAKKSDLILSEPPAFAEVEGVTEEYSREVQEEVAELAADLAQNGMKKAIKIKSTGYIVRGNTRVLATTEDYVPVDLGFFIGLFRAHVADSQAVCLRRSVVEQELEKTLNNRRRPVKPPNSHTIPFKHLGGAKFEIDLSDEYMVFPFTMVFPQKNDKK